MNNRMYEGRVLPHPESDIEDQGLRFDLGTIISRRRMLGLLGIGAGSAALAACSSAQQTPQPAATSAATSAAETSSSANQVLQELNSETAGPYPGDGSNGPDVLEASGIERRDLTTSIDADTPVAGTPMTLTMNIIDITNDNAPLVGAAVYVWHCNAAGEYSMYSNGVEGETWLRGVQVTDAAGAVTFDTIVPGCYTGRWPHIHFEVFPAIGDITDATNNVLTSQIVIPEDVATAVYGDSAYESSSPNLSHISLETDNVFSDGWDTQTPAVSGNKQAGYALTIDVPVDPTTKSASPGGGPNSGPGDFPGGGPGNFPGGGPGGPGGPDGPGGEPPAPK